MENIVTKILQFDFNMRRFPADDDELYKFSELQRDLSWDYSFPTLTSGKSNKLIKLLPTFIDKFYDFTQTY